MSEEFKSRHVDYDPFAGGEVYRVSPATGPQREVIASAQMGDVANTAFNEAISLRLNGEIDKELLEACLNKLINRHDILRATFTHRGDEICLHASRELTLNVIDLSEKSEAQQGKELKSLYKNVVATPMNLQEGPLMFAWLAELGESHYELVLLFHHIIADGWSIGLLLNELAQIYRAKGGESELAEAESFFDFAESSKLKEKEDTDIEFWREKFTTKPPTLDLPLDATRPALRTFQASRFDYYLNPKLVSVLPKLAGRLRVSLVNLVMAGYFALLNRLTGNDDIVVGLPVAGQAAFERFNMVGHMVQLLPIRISLDGSLSFKKLAAQVKDEVLNASEHANLTFGELLKDIKIDRSRVPLVSTIFNIDQAMPPLDFGTSTGILHSIPRAAENFEIFLNVVPSADELMIEATYSTTLFGESSIRSWLEALETLLEKVAENTDLCIKDIPLTKSLPEQAISANKTDTNLNYADFISAFRAQVEKTPEARAVVAGDIALTYEQLDQSSNALANKLQQQGIGANAVVGLCCERTERMLQSVLAILKLGAAYLPLDPDFPPDRLVYMLEDSGASAVIEDRAAPKQVKETPVQHIDASLTEEDLQNNVAPAPISPDPDRLAYLIYTSGSTGKPKGVRIPNRPMINFLESMARTPGCDSADKLLAVTTLSFDISVLELYLPLICGATVVIASREEVKDGNELAALIDRHNITLMQATPSTWRLLLASDWKTKSLNSDSKLKCLCGGEPLPSDLSDILLNHVSELWNMFGPTETTVWSTCKRIIQGDPLITVGEPISNTQVYILDENLQPLPVSTPGEVCIGGAGVTQGYHNRLALTAEKFVNHPEYGRIYRTGDLGKLLPNGEIQHLGRLDNQVKLRGYRIELGEIETILRKHPYVEDCALTIQSMNQDDARLIAYVVWKESEADPSEIRSYLMGWVPEYMVPQHIVRLTSLPLTPNGKLDRRSLPEITFDKLARNTKVEPRNRGEAQLLEIWQEVLGVKSIGVFDNFFDLGGHSLLIAKMLQRIESAFEILLQYRDFFDFPNIATLSSRINNISADEVDNHSKIKPRDDKYLERAALSLAQRRVWYIDKLDPNTKQFNLPSAFRFIGSLNITTLNLAFNEMVERHEILRTQIVEVDGDEPIQMVREYQSLVIEEIDLSDAENSEKRQILEEKLDQYKNEAILIGSTPLFIVRLIKISSTEHIFFFMPHHIIFDGWSFDIFIHELTTLYAKHNGIGYKPLDNLSIQYADYALWLRSYLDSEELNNQLTYWKTLLAGRLPLLELPVDYKRPSVLGSHSGEVMFNIEEDVINELTNIANEQEVSFFMLILCAYISVLYRYTGQKDLIIGIPMADRSRPGTENLIGFFVNALVLRFQVNPNEDFFSLLAGVKDTCLQGYEYQDVPFEKLVEVLDPPRMLDRHPLFQTSLTYQDVSNREVKMDDIDIIQIETPTQSSALDMSMWLKRRGNYISGGITYNLELFHHSTVVQIANSFSTFIKSVAEKPQFAIAKSPILSSVEIRNLFDSGSGLLVNNFEQGLVHNLFNKQVEKSPDSIALITKSNQLSYSDLDKQSNQFANYLLKLGIGTGDFIGVCLDRTERLLVAVIGAMKAGAAYIPLDPEYPIDRLRYMIEDSGLEYVVTQEKYIQSINLDVNLLVIENINSEIQSAPVNVPNLSIDSSSAAYVIYTSGSTGKPKGVVVPHKSVVNFLLSMSHAPGLNCEDKLLAITTLSFDISVLELYLPLVVGATVVLADRKDSSDGRCLKELVEKWGITCLQATPSTWRMFLAYDPSKGLLKKGLCGGEPMPHDLIKPLSETCQEVWNMYGPTETTVWSTCKKISNDDVSITIGSPIENTQIFILSENLEWQPPLVPGELYIGGDGLALGYLNRPELTIEKFIEHPEFGRIYRTGDLAKMLANGEIQHLGRADDQIKLRGFRIELGEIQAVLADLEEIREAAVYPWSISEKDIRLVACCVPSVTGNLQTIKIRKQLREILPSYMVPQYFLEVEEIPLLPNGKINRPDLPKPEVSDSKILISSSLNTRSEKIIGEIWTSLIKPKNSVGREDNFFEIGGHSLLALEAIRQIEKKTGVVFSPADIVVENLGTLAERIE